MESHWAELRLFVIPWFGRLKQEEQQFEVSLGFTARPFLKPTGSSSSLRKETKPKSCAEMVPGMEPGTTGVYFDLESCLYSLPDFVFSHRHISSQD